MRMDAKKFGDRGHQTFRVFRVFCGPIAFRQTTADYADLNGRMKKARLNRGLRG